MGITDYKTKYLKIRDTLLDATEVAFRLGYQQALKDSKIQQMEQQQQQVMQQAALAAQSGHTEVDENGQEIQQPEQPQQEVDQQGAEQPYIPDLNGEAPEGGSELDGYINELEGLVAKGEKPSVLSMRKAVDALASFRKAEKLKYKNNIKNNVSKQKQFVDNILKKWEGDVKEDVTDGLEDIIKQHGITIEED